MLISFRIMHQILETDFHRELIQRRAAYYLRAHLREETFLFSWELLKKELCHHRTKYGIAEIFETLITYSIA